MNREQAEPSGSWPQPLHPQLLLHPQPSLHPQLLLHPQPSLHPQLLHPQLLQQQSSRSWW